MEPAVARQELVGILTCLEERDQSLELLRIGRSDVGGLADEVLRALGSTYQTVDASVAEARVDDDGTADSLSGGFQKQMTAIGHVHHIL